MVLDKEAGIAAVCAEERDRSVHLTGEFCDHFWRFSTELLYDDGAKESVLAQGKASNDREGEGGAREEENQCPSE